MIQGIVQVLVGEYLDGYRPAEVVQEARYGAALLGSEMVQRSMVPAVCDAMQMQDGGP